MLLCTEVGLGPGDTVLDFRLMSIVAKLSPILATAEQLQQELSSCRDGRPLVTIDMGRKVGGGAVPISVGVIGSPI